jgi:hypothetical protein
MRCLKAWPRKILLGAMTFSGTLCAAMAQEAPALDLKGELQRLGEAATTLEHTLPNFTCQEKAISRALKGKKVTMTTEFVSTLRAQRAADGSLDESFSFSEVNGKPFTNGTFRLPVYVSGGFDKAMRYFAPTLQVCYRYSLSPGRIDFAAINDPPGQPQCKEKDLQGFALLDAEGNATHVERRVAPEAAQAVHEATYAAVDFAAVALNGRTYWLSQHLYAEMPMFHHPTTFSADYTDCKLFTATVTLHSVPDSGPDSGHGSVPAPNAPPDSLPH